MYVYIVRRRGPSEEVTPLCGALSPWPTPSPAPDLWCAHSSHRTPPTCPLCLGPSGPLSGRGSEGFALAGRAFPLSSQHGLRRFPDASHPAQLPHFPTAFTPVSPQCRFPGCGLPRPAPRPGRREGKGGSMGTRVNRKPSAPAWDGVLCLLGSAGPSGG